MVDRREAAGLPVQLFEREAEGFGLPQHLPRVSGISAVERSRAHGGARARAGATRFSLKLEAYQVRDPELDAAFLAAGWVPRRPRSSGSG